MTWYCGHMTDKPDRPDGRRNPRRISRYPQRLAIPVDQQTFDGVSKLADAAEVPISEIGRQLLATALPPALKMAAQNTGRQRAKA